MKDKMCETSSSGRGTSRLAGRVKDCERVSLAGEGLEGRRESLRGCDISTFQLLCASSAIVRESLSQMFLRLAPVIVV